MEIISNYVGIIPQIVTSINFENTGNTLPLIFLTNCSEIRVAEIKINVPLAMFVEGTNKEMSKNLERNARRFITSRAAYLRNFSRAYIFYCRP